MQWQSVDNPPAMDDPTVDWCHSSPVVLCWMKGDYPLVCRLQQYDDEEPGWRTADSEGWDVTEQVVFWQYVTPPDTV